jgi:hypothetical protein
LPVNAATVAWQLAEQLELTVFKMMFFRRKDLADVEQILRAQGASLDRVWVREQLAEIYGAGDPRLAAWDDLAREIPAE